MIDRYHLIVAFACYEYFVTVDLIVYKFAARHVACDETNSTTTGNCNFCFLAVRYCDNLIPSVGKDAVPVRTMAVWRALALKAYRPGGLCGAANNGLAQAIPWLPVLVLLRYPLSSNTAIHRPLLIRFWANIPYTFFDLI